MKRFIHDIFYTPTIGRYMLDPFSTYGMFMLEPLATVNYIQFNIGMYSEEKIQTVENPQRTLY